MVARQFRIKGGPANTGIGGSSYGAIAALYALVRRPDVFGIGLLESPSLQMGNGQLLRDTASLAIGPRRVYVGAGAAEMKGHESLAAEHALGVNTVNQGFAHMAEALAANLKAANLNRPAVLLVVEPDAHHMEKFWAERFPDAVSFLFPKVTAP